LEKKIGVIIVFILVCVSISVLADQGFVVSDIAGPADDGRPFGPPDGVVDGIDLTLVAMDFGKYATCAAGDFCKPDCSPADPDCGGGVCTPRPEICGNGIDEDCNGADLACACTPRPEICGNGVDEDCDGRDLPCCTPAPEICGNGVDEDCDGQDLPCCTPAPEVCGDGVDQDCDGSDLTCPTCTGTGTNNDNDAYCTPTDCNDSSATVYPGAPEVECDTVDQDCDGADSCPPPPGELVLHFNFNSVSGTSVGDLSGKGNNGVLEGGMSCTETGVGTSGNACEFDGVDDIIRVADSPTLRVTTGATVMAWIKTDRFNHPDSGSLWQGIMAKGNVPRSYSLYTRTGGNFHSSTHGIVGGSHFGSISDGTFNLNQWVHIAFTISASSSSATHTLYINGQQDSEFTDANYGLLPGDADTEDVVIGSTSEPARFLSGLIDEVKIYNKVLTLGEIQTEYDATKPPGADDNVGPTISDFVLQPGLPTGGDTVIVQSDITDTAGVASAILNVDGTDYPMTKGTGDTWEATTSALSDGSYTLTITATDSSPGSNVATKDRALSVGGICDGTQVDLPTMVCCVGTSCGGASTEIVKLSSDFNTHAALPTSGSQFGRVLCCMRKDGTPIVIKNTGSTAEFLISLSSADNAHVSDAENFAEKVYVEGITCDVKDSCPTSENCIFTMSEPTNNAHISYCSLDAGLDFTKKMCCT